MPNPYEIATWRYEQIAPFLDPSLDRAARRRVMRERTTRAIVWPHGPRKRIPRSTIHRWIKSYRSDSYLGLLPKRRSDAGKPRFDSAAWIAYAIGLLYEQPDRSLHQLDTYLRLQFDDYKMSRSTLGRHLREHPAYAGIEKRRTGRDRKLRDRFEAGHPHECWQLDGKGPFAVRLKSGERIRVHVLTVLDDHSRAVLAAIIAAAEDAASAIRVFQLAAERYGLPDRMQFDRGSAFDSHAFRGGLAQCGVHRNFVRAKDPRAQGKIERYHRTLQRWFVAELPAQEVCDVEHLQELLDASLALVYHKHTHRQIGCAPADRLADSVSERRISRSDVARAFFVEDAKKSDPTTGEVRLPNGRFRVPSAHAGKQSLFRYDPIRPRAVLVTADRREVALERFEPKPLPPVRGSRSRRGRGQLQKLVDVWRGGERPNAEPAFGLPEVFAAVGEMVERSVPASEREAGQIAAFWNRHGPVSRTAFVSAGARTRRELGPGRPIAAYLNHLERQIRHSKEGDS